MYSALVKLVLVLILGSLLVLPYINDSNPASPPTLSPAPTPLPSLAREYQVIKVIDGDTIDIQMGTQIKRVRLLGINTPETSDPRKGPECFGQEAKQYLTSLLLNQSVSLLSDPTQSDQDAYGRLLRYVFKSSDNINLQLIKQGYAYEYTYDQAYQYQQQFKLAQEQAQQSQSGLWHPSACSNVATPTPDILGVHAPDPNCNIKGNISSSGSKIYHLPGCRDYSRTVINPKLGEQWFCSEQSALQSGWTKAQSCP